MGELPPALAGGSSQTVDYIQVSEDNNIFIYLDHKKL
jgi:hypothetical protein